jgi:hypothetical protein
MGELKSAMHLSSLRTTSDPARIGECVHSAHAAPGCTSLSAAVVRAAAADLPACGACATFLRAVLVYLDNRTWTRGATSESLAREVHAAMAVGCHVLCAHEMLGSFDEGHTNAITFDDLFPKKARDPDKPTTPQDLIDAGIYAEIAVPLMSASGPLRRPSLVMFTQSLADKGLGDGEDPCDACARGDEHGQTSPGSSRRSRSPGAGTLRSSLRRGVRKMPVWMLSSHHRSTRQVMLGANGAASVRARSQSIASN